LILLKQFAELPVYRNVKPLKPMLSHLIYVSNRAQNCTQAEIEKILESCKKNNFKYDITGVLLYSNTKFVQYIEGEYKEIMGLYDRIKGDPRHTNAVLLTSSPISERSFPSWQMGAKKFDTASIDFKTSVNEGDKIVFESILSGKKAEDNKAIALMKKFFK
jgi:hypothetical protein